jgi:hypothetical protein
VQRQASIQISEHYETRRRPAILLAAAVRRRLPYDRPRAPRRPRPHDVGHTPSRNMVSEGRTRRPSGTSRPGRTSSGPRASAARATAPRSSPTAWSSSGPNNEDSYDPSFGKDAGAFIAVRREDRQVRLAKPQPQAGAGRVNDWPYQGVCAAPLVERNMLWYCTPAGARCCVRPVAGAGGGEAQAGLEARHDGRAGRLPAQHDQLVDRRPRRPDLSITGNGVDETHKNIPSPDAPAIIAINKNTGKVDLAAEPRRRATCCTASGRAPPWRRSTARRR